MSQVSAQHSSPISCTRSWGGTLGMCSIKMMLQRLGIRTADHTHWTQKPLQCKMTSPKLMACIEIKMTQTLRRNQKRITILQAMAATLNNQRFLAVQQELLQKLL